MIRGRHHVLGLQGAVRPRQGTREQRGGARRREVAAGVVVVIHDRASLPAVLRFGVVSRAYPLIDTFRPENASNTTTSTFCPAVWCGIEGRQQPEQLRRCEAERHQPAELQEIASVQIRSHPSILYSYAL